MNTVDIEEMERLYGSTDSDLLYILRIIHRDWISLILIAGFVTLVAIIISLVLPNIYRAESLLAPAVTRQVGSSIESQLGGAAALVGINLQSATAGPDPVNSTLAVMRSREFIIKFIHEHELTVPLFAGIWNSESGESEIDPNIYDVKKNTWKIETGAPTDLQAYRKFSSILTVSSPDITTGLIRVSIDWIDPILSSAWVNLLVADINRDTKLRDIADASNAIEFLEEQLETTQLVEMQRVFHQLVESQIRIKMLADVREEYAFLTIDPAMVPDQKISPNRPLIAIIGSLVGLLVAAIFVLLKHYNSNHMKEKDRKL